MKKFFNLMIAAFALMAAVSCSESFDEPVDRIPVEEELVSMSIDVDGELTRTFIGEDGKTINWCESDRIAIFDGVDKREFTIVEGTANGKSATFQGQVAASATTFYAVYPYEAAQSLDNGEVSITAMAEQQLAGENVADGAILAVGSFAKGSTNFVFNNVVGFFRVNITLPDVTEIIVQGNGIAGTATVNGAGELTGVTDAVGCVKLRPEGEVFAEGAYYVALLPGTTPAGEFSVLLDRTSEIATEMTAAREVTIPRNDGYFVNDYKLTQKFVIKDAETLRTFLSKAPLYTTADGAEVVNNIDLTGEEFTPATSFVGELDGNDYALTNWSSEGVTLFESLGGRVHNLHFDASCSLTPADQIGAFGFLANRLEVGGLISYCENRAPITLNATKYGAGSGQFTDAVYFGGLVGESYGTIDHCKNSGKITITTTPTGGDERGVVYIGGVVGKIDNTEQAAAGGSLTGLSYCENSGEISYSIEGRGGFLFLGGVAGGTTADPITSKSASCSQVENCINTGNIYHTFTQQIIGSGNAKSNYTKMAGVIGYCVGSVKECVNGEAGSTQKGKIQLNAPTLAEGDGYSAANVSVAGVSGYAFDIASQCKNYGEIKVDGSFGLGYETYSGGGNKEDGGTFIAGVIGQIGALNSTSVVATHGISDCHNHGALNLNLPITSTSSTNYKSYHHVGGVVAYAFAAANNLSNNGKITLFSEGTMNYLGGVIGQTEADATLLTNNADIAYSIKRTGGQQLNNGNQFFGGVIGYNTGDTMTSLTNNNPITLTVNNTNQKLRVGGVAGSFGAATGITNNGSVTLTDIVAHAKEVDLGGVSGATTDGVISDITNNGEVTYSGVASTGSLYIGGVIGYAASTSISEAYNKQPVSISASESFGTLYGAGISGNASGSFTDASNTHPVTIQSPSITTLYLGGISGSARSATTYTNADNSGALSATGGKTLYLAGIAGHSGGNVKFYDCDNSGAITFTAPELAAKDLYVGGICARPYAKSIYDNCTHQADISLTAASATAACYLGGIAAQPSNATSAGNGYDVEGCSVKGNITINCPATWYVGGIAAYSSQWSSTTSNHRSLIGNTVEGNITIGNTLQHFVGGIVGHTGTHVDIADNSFSGKISVGSNSTTAVNKQSNVGGIVGAWIISQTTASTVQNGEFAMSGNSVKADITYDAANGYGGLMFGAVNNIASRTSFTKYSQVSLELDGNTVLSGSRVNGTEISDVNFADYLMSDYDFTERFELEISGLDTTLFE